MTSLTTTLLSDILLYKYAGLFVITFLGAFALPLPSGTVVVAAAAFSTQGYLSFPAVLAVGVAGNVLGDHANYWLSRKIGVVVFKKIGMGKILSPEKIAYARGLLERHPLLSIFFSRFMTGIAPTVNVVAGFTQLPYRIFALFEVLGELTEVSAFSFTGYFLGSNWEYINRFSGRLWVLLAASMAATYLFWHVAVRRAKKNSP